MAEKILLIEDEEKLARMVELELRYEGYEVEKAFDGPALHAEHARRFAGNGINGSSFSEPEPNGRGCRSGYAAGSHRRGPPAES